MAEVNANAQTIQSTKDAATQTRARVFSMPARYRHGVVVAVVEPQKNVVAAKAPKAPPVPVAPKLIPPPLTKPLMANKTPSKTHHAFLIAASIVVVAIGMSAYLFVRSVQKQKPLPVSVTQNESPDAATPTESPSQSTTPDPQTSTAQDTASPFSSTISPGVDSDSDGLTDVEETLVYGTDPHLPDTDNDCFLDGN
ncbi:MAG: hypothetical protein AAB664_02270, partial [Patescibacteria group bacterium]